jgi:hypothetical protein
MCRQNITIITIIIIILFLSYGNRPVITETMFGKVFSPVRMCLRNFTPPAFRSAAAERGRRRSNANVLT